MLGTGLVRSIPGLVHLPWLGLRRAWSQSVSCSWVLTHSWCTPWPWPTAGLSLSASTMHTSCRHSYTGIHIYLFTAMSRCLAMTLLNGFHTPDWDNSSHWEPDPVGYREIQTPLNESMTGYMFTPSPTHVRYTIPWCRHQTRDQTEETRQKRPDRRDQTEETRQKRPDRRDQTEETRQKRPDRRDQTVETRQ